jgi:hypothetical protein
MSRYDEEYVPTEDWSIAGDGDVDWSEVDYVDDLFADADA